MKSILSIMLIAVLLASCGTSPKKRTEEASIKPKYEETWESLAKHNEQPEWFQDAKFGIYFHWGVYSVPAFGNEWYPRNMHIPGSRENFHHIEKYGKPSEFGYHDFVPMFKAENFDADEWAELFQRAGARFAGPVAEHHDGFAMWDSDKTPWNSMDKGPHRDILGELDKAIKSREMKLIATFHHAKQLQRYKGKEKEEIENNKDRPNQAFNFSHYPLFPDTPPTWDDPELNYLYGNVPREKWFNEVWLGKLEEVIDNYQPDIIWFDYMLDSIPEEYRLKYCAYYLNEAEKWGKEVVIVRKQDDLPLDVSVDDLEKSRKNRLEEKSWMTDETLSTGSWCYTENLQIKPAADVLHVLIDIVSKNGVLLLNISPMADGTIPENQKDVLMKMGNWLSKYGESIYETRPWYTYGEGPTKEPEGHFSNHQEFLKIKYSSKDVRFTTNGNVIYATILGWPGNNKEVIFESFSPDNWNDAKSIKKVSLLGSNENINFNIDESGLKITTPDQTVDDMACVFKVELED